MRAVLHDADGHAVNVIVLPDDGEGDYEPPDGLTLVEIDDDDCVSPGWVLVDDEWVAPEEDPPPAPPTLEELQAQIEELQAQIQQLLEQQQDPEEEPGA